MDDNRIRAIEEAYAEMKSRGWGFTSDGHGFGDPAAMMTMVGPFVDGFVEVYGADKDCVMAVQKAINRENKSVA